MVQSIRTKGSRVARYEHSARRCSRYACIPTIASQVAAANAGGTTTVAEGVAVSGTDASDIPAALALVDDADVVGIPLVCIGVGSPLGGRGVKD